MSSSSDGEDHSVQIFDHELTYDPATGHRGSQEAWAPLSDDDSPEEVSHQDAQWHPLPSKPWSFGKPDAPNDNTALNGLFKMVIPGGDLNGVEENQRWQFMPYPLVVDSGAAETVLPSDWFEHHKLWESEGSKSGMVYTAANGGELPNEGEKRLFLATVDGDHLKRMDVQVTNVNKALGSVSRMVKNGHRVVFDQDEWGDNCSYIESRTSGEKMWLRERNGVYVLDVMVGPPSYKGEVDERGRPRGFSRPSGM